MEEVQKLAFSNPFSFFYFYHLFYREEGRNLFLFNSLCIAFEKICSKSNLNLK